MQQELDVTKPIKIINIINGVNYDDCKVKYIATVYVNGIKKIIIHIANHDGRENLLECHPYDLENIPEQLPFDWDKPVRTKCGFPVIKVNPENHEALIEYPTGDRRWVRYNEDGTTDGLGRGMDLENYEPEEKYEIVPSHTSNPLWGVFEKMEEKPGVFLLRSSIADFKYKLDAELFKQIKEQQEKSKQNA